MIKENFTAVICSLNSKYIHSSLAPWYLAAGVKQFCNNKINTLISEGTINEKIEDIANRILSQKPNAAGFCCYIWNITAVTRLIDIMKSKLPECSVILGGPEVSFNPEQVLAERPSADYIISGEGERSFAMLIDCLASGADMRDIPGLCYRENGKSVTVPGVIIKEDPPFPYSTDYFKTLNGRIAYIETSRGCPYSCAFCLSGRPGAVRFFDLEKSKENIVLLANSGTKTVKFVDRTFNACGRRAKDIFRFIIDNYGRSIPYGVRFHFEIAGDILDDETIRLLKKAPAGLIQLEIGLQSLSKRTLESVNRKTDVDSLVKNIKKLTGPGNMHIHIDLIAGLPYEDMESLELSFNTAFELDANVLQLGFLKLLHGSCMRENPERYPCEYSKEPPYEVISTPWLTIEQVARLHHTEDALERVYNSGRFRRTIIYLLKQTGNSPFQLLSSFGAFCADKNIDNISLDAYTELILEYFSGAGADRTALRDALVCDRLSTDRSGKLPAALRIHDPALKAAVSRVEKIAPPKGARRSYALLYSENCLVYVEYKDIDPVTKSFPLKKLGLDSL